MWKNGHFHRETTLFSTLHRIFLLKDGAPLVQFGSTSSAIKPPSEDNKLRQDQLQTEAETELKVIYYR